METFTAFARNVGAQTQYRRKLPIDPDDAIQVATEALIHSAMRFDPSRYEAGTDIDQRFKTFVYPRLVGSVIDHSRKNAFVKRRGLDRGVKFEMLSLDHVNPDFDEPVLQVSAVEADLDMVIDFGTAFDKLSEREKYVLLGIGAGVPMWEIGQEIGLTESRISQIASAAKTKLKKGMLS